MEHLVRFQTAEGREGQHTAESLEEALRFVERLRNSEEVPDVRVYRMQEIPIEFRTYFKVELKAPEGEQVPVETSPVEAVEEPVRSGLVATPSGAMETVAVEPNGSRRLFSR